MESYELVIFLLASLSGFSTASQLQNRWLRKRNFEFYRVYLVLLALTLAWGFAFVSSGLVVPPSPSALVASVPLGLVVGHVAVTADRAILRKLSRATLRRSRSGGTRGSADGMAHGAAARARGPSTRERDPELVVLLGIGAFEELAHRGLLVALALALGSPWQTSLVLVATTSMFCAAHLHFGWAGAVAKLPLTVLALAAVLLLGTVWPAVVAHVLFNYRVWRSWREQPHFVAGAASARRISL